MFWSVSPIRSLGVGNIIVSRHHLAMLISVTPFAVRYNIAIGVKLTLLNIINEFIAVRLDDI